MLLLPALAFVPGWATFGGTGVASDSALAAGVGQDVLADLTNRSPGARLSAVATLKDGIPRLIAARTHASEPQQRALGKVFDAPTLDEAVFGPQPAEEGLLSFGAPSVADLPTEIVPIRDIASRWIPGGAAPGGGSPLVPGGPSGGGGGGDNGGTPPVILPPVGAVPEPEAWALMIVGFGMVGAALRTRHRRVRLSPHA